MPLSFPPLQELSSVHAALAWLLAEKPTENGAILADARAKGLIISDEGPHWKADGGIMTSLTESALPRLPSDAGRLGEIMHGIGEISARCHAQTLPTLFVNYLKSRQADMRLSEVFGAAVRCDSRIPRQINVGNVAFGQWLARSTLSWSTFDQAVVRIGHPDDVFGGFGLKFVARVIFCIAPHVIDAWITDHPDHPAVSIIGSAALTMVFPFDHESAIAPLLESATPAIKCLGAAAVVCPVAMQSGLSFRDCHKALVDAGFAPADATWMSGMRIKNAIHARYRIEHAREENTARLRYIEKNPDKAIGGIRNAEFEMNHSRAQLTRADEAYATLLPELEGMLSAMAADWPGSGLSEEQMQSLEFIFVDTAEIRHRLATKLSHTANRDWLLKRNIDRLVDFVGLRKNPGDISKQYFLPDERQYNALAHWAAQSLVLLYDPDNRGVGRRTSDLVLGVATAAERLMAQPFISGRQPDAWHSIMTRAACADRFAFMVIASTPEARQETVMRLNDLALDFAFKLLSARNLPERSGTAFHQLTAQAAQHIELLANADESRETWALADALPDFARALALWASPSLVEKHKELALHLFRRICVPPLSRSNYNLQMSRMLTLLDTAIASATEAQKGDLVSDLKRLWIAGYRDWIAIVPQYESIAEKLALAVEKDGPERAEIIGDAIFTHSRCRQLIDAASNDPEAML